MYNHILVAIDLSPKSNCALSHAIKLAHFFNSKITLINVHEEFLNKKEMIMSRVSVDSLQKTYKDISLKAKSEITHLLNDLHAEDIETNILLREGNASEEILKLSDEISPDLIVIGSNGEDSLSDYFIGTTSNHIVDKSNIPVLVIPVI